MANIIHVLDVGRSDVILYQIKNRRSNVRCWHNSDGELIGMWQGRNGRTYALTQRGRQVVTYRCMTPSDNWANGPADCVHGYDRGTR